MERHGDDGETVTVAPHPVSGRLEDTARKLSPSHPVSGRLEDTATGQEDPATKLSPSQPVSGRLEDPATKPSLSLSRLETQVPEPCTPDPSAPFSLVSLDSTTLGTEALGPGTHQDPVREVGFCLCFAFCFLFLLGRAWAKAWYIGPARPWCNASPRRVGAGKETRAGPGAARAMSVGTRPCPRGGRCPRGGSAGVTRGASRVGPARRYDAPHDPPRTP